VLPAEDHPVNQRVAALIWSRWASILSSRDEALEAARSA
jgi:hypothetical protein